MYGSTTPPPGPDGGKITNYPNQNWKNAAFLEDEKKKPRHNLIIYAIQKLTILSQQNKGDIT